MRWKKLEGFVSGGQGCLNPALRRHMFLLTNLGPMSTVFRPERRASLKDSYGHPLQPHSLSTSSLMPFLPSSGVPKPQPAVQLWYSQITSGICSAELYQVNNFALCFENSSTSSPNTLDELTLNAIKGLEDLAPVYNTSQGEAVHG